MFRTVRASLVDHPPGSSKTCTFLRFQSTSFNDPSLLRTRALQKPTRIGFSSGFQLEAHWVVNPMRPCKPLIRQDFAQRCPPNGRVALGDVDNVGNAHTRRFF
jgi:hypothetical protein